MLGAILLGPLAKIGFYVVGAIVGAGVVLGAYHMWKKSVQAEANQAIIIRQLEQALVDTRKTIAELEALQELVDDVSSEVKKQVDTANEILDRIEEDVDAGEDRPASNVLKDTIGKLGGER